MSYRYLIALLFWGSTMVNAANNLPDFDKLWDYQKPAETEVKFRALLPEAEKSGNAEYHLQLLTQMARTQSLQKKFKEAHEILDGVEKKLTHATPTAEVRYLLERGRSFNSDKKIPQAFPLFEKAFDLGKKHHLDYHAIDAAHMMAIAEKDPSTQMNWNLKAVALAEKSKDDKAQGWLGSLYNNIGWTYHEEGKFTEALGMFEKALGYREKKNDEVRIRVAKWCVARALRSLKRYDEAMKIQRGLEVEFNKLVQPDGFVLEEIAELLLVQGHAQEAKPYFGEAYKILSQDIWLKDSEPKRIERLKELSN
ncbi:MAG: tetratricopeptide repeat protein [Bdellovibrionota bacterium]